MFFSCQLNAEFKFFVGQRLIVLSPYFKFCRNLCTRAIALAHKIESHQQIGQHITLYGQFFFKNRFIIKVFMPTGISSKCINATDSFIGKIEITIGITVFNFE